MTTRLPLPNRDVILASRATRLRPGRYGVVLYNHHDDTIGRAVDRYGEWAQNQCDVLAPYLRAGDVVGDVGANIGTHALFFSSIVGDTGRVYAFEPQEEIFHLLAANAAINGRGNIEVVRAAVGQSSGTVCYAVPDYERTGNFGAVSMLQPPWHPGPVEIADVTPIDSFALQELALLKIDVEGMELAVLQGAALTVERCAPIIYTRADSRRHAALVSAWLLDAGYRVFDHETAAFNAANFAGEKENIFGEATERNFLAIPHRDPRIPVGLPEVAG